MPVVIRELVIRANVTENPQGESAFSSAESQSSKEEIIKECVEQVMEILKQKTER
ncbi:DUF5908 family protein [Sunxiuqinia indica]|uniref:DUF5908 family protein n=1 Tax=Sunxiuqinia indica TaxID=2692584 RepID=UPI001916B59E|nr:DUF5908 family protein [Sunxiuqinia indica]